MHTDLLFAQDLPWIRIKFEDAFQRLSLSGLYNGVNLSRITICNTGKISLRFLGFQEGRLMLSNRSGDEAYTLVLQADNEYLYVYSHCGCTKAVLCLHAYKALVHIIEHFGACYFGKLLPNGLFAVAFAHPAYFDTIQSEAGLDIRPRSELAKGYRLSTGHERLELPRLLQDRTPVLQQTPEPCTRRWVYMITIPLKNNRLPAVVPCMGLTGKTGTGIKSFGEFLSGLQAADNKVITDNRQILQEVCLQLWKQVEALPENCLHEDALNTFEDNFPVIKAAWQTLIPLLQNERYVYSYHYYGIHELKGRPQRNRITPVQISCLQPELRFELTEHADWYRLEMQVWVKHELLKGCDTSVPLFICHDATLYLWNSCTDVITAGWMHQHGGYITVFKTHFSLFEKEWLDTLKAHYPVSIKRASRHKIGNRP